MHHVCPKGGGGAGIIGEQDIQEDNMDDAIESEKTASTVPVAKPKPPASMLSQDLNIVGNIKTAQTTENEI